MAYQKAITADGYKLLADKGNPVVADSFVLSQTKLSDINSANLDSITNPLTFKVRNVMYNDGYYCPIATISNHNVNSDFIVNTIGLVGHPINQDNSVLLAVISDDDPITIPPDSEGIFNKLVMFRLNNYITSSIDSSTTSYESTSNVDLSNYVNQQQLNNALSSYASNLSLSNYLPSNALKSYVTNDGLATSLSNYVDGNSLRSALAGYATQSFAGNQYQNAVNTAENYTDNNQLLSMPKYDMQPGDSFNNYDGKAIHLSIDGLNLVKDIDGGSGLPNAPLNGDFISIPNKKSTTQIINDDLGNRWSRVSNKPWNIFVNSNLIAYDKNSIKTVNIINSNPSAYQLNNVSALYDPNTSTITMHGSITTISSTNANDPIIEFNISGYGMNNISGSNINSQTLTMDTDTLRQNINFVNTNDQASGYTWSIDGYSIKIGYDASLKPKFNPNHVDLITDSNKYNSKNAYATYDANSQRLTFTGKVEATDYPNFDSSKPIFYIDLSAINATNAYNIGFNDTYYSVTFSNNRVYLYPTAAASAVYANNHGFDITGGSFGISL